MQKQEIYCIHEVTVVCFTNGVPPMKQKKIVKAFEETVVMPFPKHKILITLYSRNTKMVFEEKFTIVFDPENSSYFKKNDHSAPVIEIQSSGPPEKNVDIAILPEGYTGAELGKFISDCHSLRRVCTDINHLLTFSRINSTFMLSGFLLKNPEVMIQIIRKK